MFLGLVVFFILAIAAYIIAIRAVKALFRLLTGRRNHPEQPDSRKEKKAAKEDGPSRSESEAKTHREGNDREQETDPVVEEQIRNRHEGVLSAGITESFSDDESGFTLDPKAIADRCTESSSLTYLEFNNRGLAGKDYYGFNLIIEKDWRMVLTYNGQAVASITKTEVKSTVVINGQEVEGTVPAWRINTYPPSLNPGLTPSDLGKMLSAVDRIKECGRDPALAADRMLSAFSDPENITRLKMAVDRKIQLKVSSEGQTKERRPTNSPKRIS